MTAQELFNFIVGIMGITTANATSYTDTILPQINLILAQNFELENNNRRFLNLGYVDPIYPILTTIPFVTALSETLTYQPNVLRNVVSFGVAQLLALSDDDTVRAGFFESRYVDGQRLESKFIPSDIIDYFSTGDE